MTGLSAAPKARKCIHWQLVLISVGHSSPYQRKQNTFSVVLRQTSCCFNVLCKGSHGGRVEQQLVKFCELSQEPLNVNTHSVIPDAMIISQLGIYHTWWTKFFSSGYGECPIICGVVLMQDSCPSTLVVPAPHILRLFSKKFSYCSSPSFLLFEALPTSCSLETTADHHIIMAALKQKSQQDPGLHLGAENPQVWNGGIFDHAYACLRSPPRALPFWWPPQIQQATNSWTNAPKIFSQDLLIADPRPPSVRNHSFFFGSFLGPKNGRKLLASLKLGIFTENHGDSESPKPDEYET